jgi:cytoskeletal protein RodZ
MSYSPNDGGPNLPPTRSSTRSAGIWIGLVVIILIGAFLWWQSGTPTDPATTPAATEPAASQSTIAPTPGTDAPAGDTTTEPAPGAPAPATPSTQP